MFMYVDAVVVGTPILDQVYRRAIEDAALISDRLQRASVFRSYLDRQWRAVETALPDPPFPWRDHSAHLAEEIERINERVERRGTAGADPDPGQ